MNPRNLLHTTYWAGFLLNCHVALISYINSSFLATKMPESAIGALYTGSAILGVIGLYAVPKLINRFGSRPVIGTILVINIANLVALIVSGNIIVIAACFVLYFALNTSLFLGLDILVEHWSENAVQGSVRGIYLTAMNLGFMLGPFMGGFIVDRLGYGTLYGFAIVLILPVFVLIATRLPSITHTHASKANIIGLARKFINHPKLGSVFFANFILQFFYAWMVIYTPIYLHEYAHIPWDTIGIMFTVMLSSFVLLQYVVGKLADRFHFEKDMIVFGLLIMGIATMFVSKAPTLGFWTLAGILFATRVGASILEVMTESYFFKNVHHDDTGTIGFFRNTYPFAYILAPLIASLLLRFAPMGTLFIVLGGICILATTLTLNMRGR